MKAKSDNNGSNEPIARFLLHSKWINKANKTVKHQAFQPDNRTGTFELSTYRIAGLSNKEILRTGNLVSQDAGGKNLYGFASLQEIHFTDQNLQLHTDNIPRQGHTNILNWPTGKDDIKLIRLELARLAEFVPI